MFQMVVEERFNVIANEESVLGSKLFAPEL